MENATREELVDIWHDCFDVSDEFVRLYFTAKYRPGRARAYRENGRVVASLILVPYRAATPGRVVDLAYVAGACTREERRGEGIMTRLLADSLRDARAGGYALSALIPSGEGLFEYYKRSGYSAVFDRARVEERDDGHDYPLSVTREISPGEARAFLDARLPPSGTRVLHDSEDFEAIAEELALSGGAIIAAFSPGDLIEGVALVAPEDGKVIIKEEISDTPGARHALARAITTCWPGKKQEWTRIPGPADATKPYGMARVLDAGLFLRLHAARHPGQCRLLQVVDEIIPGNNGTFALEHGHCRRVQGVTGRSVERMNIEELTGFLLRDDIYPPYMNLMMD
ncbi:MAG: GNAT family N-acetyltransferase [Odoribacteraceae bacterium]|jgi:GNAT superfamily N-acetyltransferase|nr:GNAT family N-acetyltransferase [Odoribacteraceae bacterium]